MLTGATGGTVGCKGAEEVVRVDEIGEVMGKQPQAHPNEPQMEMVQTRE